MDYVVVGPGLGPLPERSGRSAGVGVGMSRGAGVFCCSKIFDPYHQISISWFLIEIDPTSKIFKIL